MSDLGVSAVTPAVETIVPVVDNSTVTQATAAPVAAAAPEATPVAPAPETALAEAPKAPETLLTEAIKAETKEPPKVEPEAPKVEAQNTEGDQSVEPAPPPTYEPFVVPEGVKLDDTRVKDFTGLLAELEQSGKADHTAVQAFGQKAVDFHINEIKKAVTDVQKFYQTSFENQKNAWRDQTQKDPEIGGNRFDTSVKAALTFIRTHGGTQEQQTEFKNLMETSGLGNHPAMIRLLAKAGAAMSEGRLLQATTPPAAPKSKVATMYGKTN